MADQLKYRRGAPITIRIVIRDTGAYDPSTLTVNAALKAGAEVPPPGTPVVATFTCSFVAAVGSATAYWELSIPGAVSAGLTPGTYITDAEILSAGVVIDVTEPLLLWLSDTVTPMSGETA